MGEINSVTFQTFEKLTLRLQGWKEPVWRGVGALQVPVSLSLIDRRFHQISPYLTYVDGSITVLELKVLSWLQPEPSPTATHLSLNLHSNFHLEWEWMSQRIKRLIAWSYIPVKIISKDYCWGHWDQSSFFFI